MPHYCEWMKKMWYFIQWNLFSHKEKWNFVICK
jgi:hypothetical protein